MPDEIASTPAPDADPWLTVQQVSEELTLHPSTIRAWVKSGRLRAVRAGRSWRVRRSEVDRALLADPSPAYAGEAGGAASGEAEAALARTPAPRQIAGHIMVVGPGAAEVP